MSKWTCELETVPGPIGANDVEIERLSYPTANSIAAVLVQLGMNCFQNPEVSESQQDRPEE